MYSVWLRIVRPSRDSDGFAGDGNSNADVYSGCVKSLFGQFRPNFGLLRPKFSDGPPPPLLCWGPLYHHTATSTVIVYIYPWYFTKIENFDDFSNKDENDFEDSNPKYACALLHPSPTPNKSFVMTQPSLPDLQQLSL